MPFHCVHGGIPCNLAPAHFTVHVVQVRLNFAPGKHSEASGLHWHTRCRISPVAPVFSHKFCELEDKGAALFPAEAGIGDGLAVDAFADLLAAVFDVALDHEAFHDAGDVGRVAAAGHDVFGDADLLHVFLAGVVVIAVDDDGGIGKGTFSIKVENFLQVLVVVVRHAGAEVVHIAAEDGVGERISCGVDFPSVEEEVLLILCGFDGVHHDGEVAGGRVLHADGDTGAAGDHAVQLVLDGTRADRAVGEEVGEVAVVFRVEDLFGAGEAGLFDDVDVHTADGFDAFHHVFIAFGVWLVEHAFVSFADGSRLIRVDSGYDEELVLHFICDFRKARAVVEDGRLIVCRAGTDDEEKSVVFAGHDVLDDLVSFCFHLSVWCAQRDLLLHFNRFRQFADESHLFFHRFDSFKWKSGSGFRVSPGRAGP